MPVDKKPKKEKGKSQKERFIETAQALEADETGSKFQELFTRLIPEKRPAK